ncbi:YrzI family small protein [Bacillus sp. HMF5848]|nr:YrzI family small protein [Bacillus sp. HMF5848]RSK27952.1 YrzI family small protein [Bacillus sp. HMF5848]
MTLNIFFVTIKIEKRKQSIDELQHLENIKKAHEKIAEKHSELFPIM